LPRATDDGVQIVGLAILRVHHDVLHAALRIGGDTLSHHADVAAVQCERIEIATSGSTECCQGAAGI
jgi:hypothetical protein